MHTVDSAHLLNFHHNSKSRIIDTSQSRITNYENENESKVNNNDTMGTYFISKIVRLYPYHSRTL